MTVTPPPPQVVKEEHDNFLEHPIIRNMIHQKITRMGVRYIMAVMALLHVAHMVVYSVAARPERPTDDAFHVARSVRCVRHREDAAMRLRFSQPGTWPRTRPR